MSVIFIVMLDWVKIMLYSIKSQRPVLIHISLCLLSEVAVCGGPDWQAEAV